MMLLQRRPKKSNKYNDFYIARMEWTNDANVLSAQVLNRHQDNLIY
jgi:dipeptidyl-peptidase-4